MKNKRKVCIVITTRGNYAKMKSVIEAINENKNLELQLIVGGGAILSKYGNIVESIRKNGIKIDRTIHFLVEGENPITMAKSAGLAVNEVATVFESLKPDTVIVIADRFESLPIAMAASYMNIPLVHVEGGEVSGSIDESIRHSITKLSHLHFPATKGAAERIKKLGEAEESILAVGCSSLDVISQLDLNDKSILHDVQKKRGVGPVIDLKNKYIVVIQHPVTTEYEENFHHINQTIEAIDQLKLNTIWLWPNMDAGSDGISKGIRMYREKKNAPFVHYIKSLPIEEYAVFLNNCSCIVGNSSSGIREASFLGIPCVNIGTRQSGREKGENVLDVNYDVKKIKEAVLKQISVGRYKRDYLYGDGKTGKKIADIISSYNFAIQKRIIY